MKLNIALLAGDGIGPEIMAPTIMLLEAMSKGSESYELRFITTPAGAAHYAATGVALPPA